MIGDTDPKHTSLSGLELFQKLKDGEIEPSPYARAAGVTVVDLGEGRAVIAATPGDQHLNQIGMVHGGWVTTIMDSTLGGAAHTLLPAGRRAVTIEIKVNLTRPVLPGSLVTATAEVLHSGRRTIVSEGKLRDEQDRLLAVALATFAVVDVPSA
ncbi:MAG: PaaI family thioesterase [Thermoleophilia bacterium]